MDEESQPSGESGPTRDSASEIKVPEPLSAPAQQPTAEQQLEKVESDLSAFERSTLRWTKVTFVVFAGTMVFVALQWNAMREQLKEMKGGGADTHSLAVVAKKQSEDTASLAVAAGDQVKKLQALTQATLDSVAVNREALESVQRAFITFGPNLETTVATDAANKVTTWEFRPRLENSGVTPTRSATHRMSFFHGPLALQNNFQHIDLGPSDTAVVPFVIGPKQTITGANMQLAPEIIDSVKQHREHLYFWGWARYRDVFPRTTPHITMFCAEVTDIRGNTQTTGAGAFFLWSLCQRHNCADDECNGEPYGTPTKIWPN